MQAFRQKTFLTLLLFTVNWLNIRFLCYLNLCIYLISTFMEFYIIRYIHVRCYILTWGSSIDFCELLLCLWVPTKKHTTNHKPYRRTIYSNIILIISRVIIPSKIKNDPSGQVKVLVPPYFISMICISLHFLIHCTNIMKYLVYMKMAGNWLY